MKIKTSEAKNGKIKSIFYQHARKIGRKPAEKIKTPDETSRN